jgi:hypothetical protein
MPFLLGNSTGLSVHRSIYPRSQHQLLFTTTTSTAPNLNIAQSIFLPSLPLLDTAPQTRSKTANTAARRLGRQAA